MSNEPGSENKHSGDPPERQDSDSPAQPADGMPDAFTDAAMTTAEKMRKNLAEAMQKLPTGILGDLIDRNLADSGAPAFRHLDWESPSASPEALARLVGPALSPPESFPTSASPQGRGAGASVQPGSFVQLLIEHVATLKQINASHMEVVLRPDAETEIRLHLQVAGQETRVSAQLERGNQEQMEAHWGELQQALAQRGIRLGVLNEPLSQNHVSTESHEPADESPDDRRTQQFDWEAQPSRGLARHRRTTTPQLATASAAPKRRGGWEFWA
jgi:hypothetical protein